VLTQNIKKKKIKIFLIILYDTFSLEHR